jgi:hypothetical protein
VEAVELLEALALLNEADVHANMRDVIVALMHFNTPAPAPLPALQAKVCATNPPELPFLS